MTDFKKREMLAYNQAGICVAIFLMGGKITGNVSIDLDEDNYDLFDYKYFFYESDFELIKSRSFTKYDDERYRKHFLICLAGCEAEKIFDLENFDTQKEKISPYSDVANISKKLNPGQESVVEHNAKIMKDFLSTEKNWKAVDGLATALFKAGTFSGEEAEGIIVKHFRLKYSETTQEVRETNIKYIDERWGYLNRLVQDYTTQATKYLFLTNAGGAVALLGYWGTTKGAPDYPNLKYTFCLFLFGVIFAGGPIATLLIDLNGLLTGWVRDSSGYYKDKISFQDLIEIDKKRVGTPIWPWVLGFSSFACFILSVAGVMFQFLFKI